MAKEKPGLENQLDDKRYKKQRLKNSPSITEAEKRLRKVKGRSPPASLPFFALRGRRSFFAEDKIKRADQHKGTVGI